MKNLQMNKINLFATLLCFAAACFSPLQASGDLVMHLSGDGDSLDQSGNGHHGQNGNLNGPTFTGGVLGQAFSFDSADEFLTVDANAALEPTNISVAFWVKTQASGGIKLLVDSSHGGTNGNFGWAIQMTSGGQVGIAYGNGGGFPALDSTTNLADDQFHHFAATLDGTNMRTYVDGVLETTASYSGTPMGTGEQIRIGRHHSLGRQFSGLMDDIRVYNHALTSSEVQALAAVPEPTSCLVLAFGAVTLAMRRRRNTRR